MKIAVPTRNDVVDDHFGHCESYTVYSINDKNEIVNKEVMQSPVGCGCKSNIGAILQQKGVLVMLAGNMGMGALNVLAMNGINVFRGCSGNTDEVVANFLAGKVEDSGIGCHHHGEEHTCNN
jgi:predicted Fe-Mo cluster-binding NifX family protein